MTSDIQLKANQENAKLGGVNTEEGKEVAKYNAQKHLILRQAITDYEKDFYLEIVDEFEKHYSPIGTVEQTLVEKIAICYLKLFRLQKAESEFMNSKLNPRITRTENAFDIEGLLGKEVVVNEGYTPRITFESVEKLLNIYSRYETTIENRLYKAMHELERLQRLRKGENIPAPLTADITQMGSFGERG